MKTTGPSLISPKPAKSARLSEEQLFPQSYEEFESEQSDYELDDEQAASLLVFMQESAEPSSSLLLVKNLLDAASKKEGPLKADAFELIIRKAILALPLDEQIEINQYLATLPENYLKKLNIEGKGFSTELKDAAVSKAVESGVVQLATTAAATFVAAPIMGPFAPAVGSVVGAATTPVITACAGVVGKQAAKVVNSSTVAKVGQGITFAYDRAVSILPARGRNPEQPAQPMPQPAVEDRKPDIFIT
ncbi:MAG: hypothetical protein JSR17_12930 [Proteobacteria bacterium]|nr:hypothetical protein [Pseudomonadota bacterium]